MAEKPKESNEKAISIESIEKLPIQISADKNRKRFTGGLGKDSHLSKNGKQYVSFYFISCNHRPWPVSVMIVLHFF